MRRILIVEDDPAILKGLEVSLGEEHYRILSAMDGEEGYQLAREENVDLIILDVMLPRKNGDEICRDLRAGGIETPILMLTSKKEETDKVLGLELGADDYMTKPFSVRELQARIRALLRRHKGVRKDIDDCTFGDVHIDFRRQEADKAGIPVKLSGKEYEVLKYLVQHEREVVTRNMLLDEVWGYEAYPATRTVDNYILSLRKKLEDNPSQPKHLLTAHASGYKFVKG
ncbi:MAG: response regulator transcription factor [Fidelibacterota bacterium]|nr:MAG: response regulator transcription factor [Candidatus Neomarinimicrobiota bacterium]